MAPGSTSETSKYTKVAVHASGVVVGVVVIAAVFVFEQRRTQAELGAVLSAYLSDEVLHNPHDWGSGRGIQVVLQREAQPPGTWRWRWHLLFDRRLLLLRPDLGGEFVLTTDEKGTIVEAKYVRSPSVP